MYFLAIETSCDETAAAVFTDEPRVLSNVVASQTDLHSRFGGVVPEVAARAHMQRLLPIVDEALATAGVTLNQIGAVAVHHMPGLVGALLVGVSAAKALSLALDGRSWLSITSTLTCTPAGWLRCARSFRALVSSSAAGTPRSFAVRAASSTN